MGNVYAALVSWLAAKCHGGRWILRIEDLDPQRSRMEYARQIEDDLQWLGLEWDEGGIGGVGDRGPYLQSLRHDLYSQALQRLADMGLTYPCRCTRADIFATQAPHESDGRLIYKGTCRPCVRPPFPPSAAPGAVRLFVPDREICFTDAVFGPQRVNLARHCGDFVLRRADGAWAYQLAVVVDDALMGVNQVVRGADLLLSAAQQIYLFELLGFTPPQYAHLPLLCNEAGQRLSKRDASLSMAELRKTNTPEQIVGRIAYLAGLLPEFAQVSPRQLISSFDFKKLPITSGLRTGL